MSTTVPALDSSPILFVDLDGTVRHGYDELGRFVNEPADVVVFPEAVERMRVWRDGGGLVVAVTNQGGVGLGYMTEDVHQAVIRETVRQADGQLDHVVACEHRPDAGCWCRKPLPGLLYRGAQWAGWPGPRQSCLMVGDRPEDRAAADAAGVPFLDAAHWRAGRGFGGDES